jgi:general secretion pathway protein N
MKLTLDLSHPKLPKLFWFALVIVSLWTLVWQMPASWVSGILSSQTGCRVMLQQPTGTIWRGSAALAFSETNASEGGCREPHAVTERFHWASACSLTGLTCNTEIQFVALDKPQLLTWGLNKTQIAANEVKLPANVLEGLGNPWSTLRPRGQLGARWTDLSLGGIVGASDSSKNPRSGVIRIIISNLSSPISPIKPLGAYEISANIGDDGLNWSLSTTSGPLLLRGQGDTKLGVHFEGDASASPEAQDSLMGLLALLGKKEGDSYRLKF